MFKKKERAGKICVIECSKGGLLLSFWTARRTRQLGLWFLSSSNQLWHMLTLFSAWMSLNQNALRRCTFRQPTVRTCDMGAVVTTGFHSFATNTRPAGAQASKASSHYEEILDHSHSSAVSDTSAVQNRLRFLRAPTRTFKAILARFRVSDIVYRNEEVLRTQRSVAKTHKAKLNPLFQTYHNHVKLATGLTTRTTRAR